MAESNAKDVGNYSVTIYDPKQRIPDGMRQSVVTFKTPKAKKDDKDYVKPKARAVLVPKVKVHSTPNVLDDAWQTAFNDMQDGLIRDLVLKALDDKKDVITLMHEQINIEAVAKWAAENASSGKLTKEQITDWFDEFIADDLTVKVANAMKLPEKPTAEQEKRVADAVTNYRTTFAALSAPKSDLSPKIAKQLRQVLDVADDKEHRVFRSLSDKLNDIITKQDPELIALNLGA